MLFSLRTSEIATAACYPDYFREAYGALMKV
jgi:hypothetical protein